MKYDIYSNKVGYIALDTTMLTSIDSSLQQEYTHIDALWSPTFKKYFSIYWIST